MRTASEKRRVKTASVEHLVFPKVPAALATTEEAVQDVSGKGLLIFPSKMSLFKIVLLQLLLIKMIGEQYSKNTKLDSDLCSVHINLGYVHRSQFHKCMLLKMQHLTMFSRYARKMIA